MRNRRTRGGFLPTMAALMVLAGAAMAGASQSGIANLVSRAREVVFGDSSDRERDAGPRSDGDTPTDDGHDWVIASGDTDPKDHRVHGLANALDHRGGGRQGDHESQGGHDRGDHDRGDHDRGDHGRGDHGHGDHGRSGGHAADGGGRSAGEGQRWVAPPISP